MMDPVFQAFGEELEKRAISVGLLQRTLAGRAAQGVGGAAALGRQVAGAAAGGATTARQALAAGGGLAKARMGGVVEGGLAARRVESAMAGPKSGLLARVQAAEAMPATQRYDMSRPLRTHEGYMGGEHAYSAAHQKLITGGAGAVHDPKGLMQRAPTRMETAPTAVTGTAHTQLANVNQALDRTAVGQIGGKRLSSPGSPFGRTAVTSQRTGLAAPQPAQLGLEAPAGGWGGGASATGGTVVKKRRAIPAMAAAT